MLLTGIVQALSIAAGSRGAGAGAEAGAEGLMAGRVILNGARAAALSVCSLLGSVQLSILILATKVMLYVVWWNMFFFFFLCFDVA